MLHILVFYIVVMSSRTGQISTRRSRSKSSYTKKPDLQASSSVTGATPSRRTMSTRSFTDADHKHEGTSVMPGIPFFLEVCFFLKYIKFYFILSHTGRRRGDGDSRGRGRGRGRGGTSSRGRGRARGAYLGASGTGLLIGRCFLFLNFCLPLFMCFVAPRVGLHANVLRVQKHLNIRDCPINKLHKLIIPSQLSLDNSDLNPIVSILIAFRKVSQDTLNGESFYSHSQFTAIVC